MLKTVWQMDNTRIALIRRDEVREEKLRPVGATLCHIPLQHFADAYHATARSEQVESIARGYIEKAQSILEPSGEEIYDAARTYVANRKIMDEYGCHAVTMDCLRLVGEKITPPPCMAYFQLLNERTCGCCEGDITGALSLMLSSYLFDKPGFLHNPVVDNVNNNYGGAHCVAPTMMDGFGDAEEPMILRSHHESDWGVATQVILREKQPATVMKFIDPGALWAATGTILHNVDTQPHDGIGGCRTGFAMAMDNVHDARDIRGHHNVLVYGKYLPELRAWCQLAGIRAEHITGGVL
jgi:L-fucose isomerase-like protein